MKRTTDTLSRKSCQGQEAADKALAWFPTRTRKDLNLNLLVQFRLWICICLQLRISFIPDFIRMLQAGANRVSLDTLLDTDTIRSEQEKLLNQCSCCHKVYSTKSALLRHMRYECGVERRFKCQVCNRLFRHKHHLRYHLNLHVKYNEGQNIQWEDRLLHPL